MVATPRFRRSICAGKHGVIGLTKCAAMDNAARGVRLNAICPGCIDTPMGDGILPAAMTEFLNEQPIGRMGRPEEIAAAVLWLCCPASSFVIGVALPVDRPLRRSLSAASGEPRPTASRSRTISRFRKADHLKVR
jgi:NAD(P)-dependent dehydrogenase (short-subunit alcohol dehydrogenase family)